MEVQAAKMLSPDITGEAALGCAGPSGSQHAARKTGPQKSVDAHSTASYLNDYTIGNNLQTINDV